MINRPTFCFSVAGILIFLNSPYHWNNWSVIHTHAIRIKLNTYEIQFAVNLHVSFSMLFFLLYSFLRLTLKTVPSYKHSHRHTQTNKRMFAQTHTHTQTNGWMQVRKEAVCKWMYNCILHTAHHHHRRRSILNMPHQHKSSILLSYSSAIGRSVVSIHSLLFTATE